MGNLLTIMLASSPPVVLGGTALEYLSAWHPEQVQKLFHTFEAEGIPKIKNLKDIKEIRNSFQVLVSLGQELDLCFKIPNQQILSNMTPPPSPNQVVAVFINFLLLMMEVITYCETIYTFEEKYSIENPSKDLKFVTKNLETELGFLSTFVGDTAMHLQPTPPNNIMMDIEAVVNEVGSFIFSYIFTFVLHMVITEADILFLSTVKDIEATRKEVGNFLCSIINESVEDMPLQTTAMAEMKNEMAEIKDLVCKVRTFTHFFVSIEKDQLQEARILDLTLYKLLPKFELLKTKIKEHCIDVSKMPRTIATTSTHLVSLFIVDSVLDDLMYLIDNEPHMIAGVNDQISKLHEELMLLGSFVNKIAKQSKVEYEQLIIQTGDLAYEVEYVINSFPPVWYLTIRLPQLIEKIRLITTSVKEVKCGDIEAAKSLDEQSSLPSGYSPDLEYDVVGFKELEIKIAEQLFGGTERLQIISIYGMPGLGKTTLANKLYSHPSAINRFHCRAWCVSSQTHNKRNMLINILLSLGHLKKDEEKEEEEDHNNIEDEDLGGKVYKFIKQRRYLLVIDDIWDINAWNDLKRYFPDDGNGSRILFTTRNKEVGLEASASIVKELPFLSDAECWELLERRVFNDENCPQELLDIGKKIATKCRGLPLAVVVIAGVLANMEKEEHLWQKVESSISSHIAGSQDKCMQLLELSYKHLPLYLKPCFLYFGAFKEDAEIPVQMLTSVWIAERFIKNEDGKSLEGVALEYLMKLIDRSLVLVSKRRSNGKVKTCKIHDLLLEMCSRIAEENCFVKKVASDCDQVLYQQHHCLRFICNRKKSSNYIPPFGLHMRSLLCTDVDLPMFFSSSFKVLKVFHFYEIEDERFVIGLEHLVHLRYLAIKSEMVVIKNLVRLEFLEVENDRDVEITEVLLNMVNLRRMHFKGGAFFGESCRQQATSEESFQINNKVIQSISIVKISDEIDERIMRCFPNLLKLEAKLQGSFSCSFAFLHQLESLKLTTESSYSFINLPANLKQLTLVKGQISPEQMEIIWRLEYLEVLKLECVEFEGDQWDTSEAEFAQLRVLKLKWVEISEWNASVDNFPSLQKLILEHCRYFKIPSDFGDIPTLERIEVFRCAKSVEESAKQIEKEQEDAGNEILTILISSSESEISEEEKSETEEREENEHEELSDQQTEH